MHSEQVSSLLQSTLNIYFFKNEGDVLAKYLVKLYLVPPPTDIILKVVVVSAPPDIVRADVWSPLSGLSLIRC